MATKSRIRWTAEEQEAVITAAKGLIAKGSKMTADQRLAKAQAALPKNRRRPSNANLSSWLSKAVRGDAPVAKAAAVAGKGGVGRAQVAVSSSTLTQALISAGAVVLQGILTDRGVQRAFRQLVGKA